MNPFYAPDFQSLQMSPMRAALEPMPLYQPRDTGYMGIYTKPMEKESPAISPVLKGLSAPFGDSEVGGSGQDAPTYGGKSTPSFGVGYNTPGTVGKALGSVFGFGPSIVGSVLGSTIGTERVNRDLLSLGIPNQVSPVQTAIATTMGPLAGIFGFDKPQEAFTREVVSQLTPDQYAAYSASITGQGTIPGFDLNVAPGQGGPGTPGADPTVDSGVGQTPESTYARGGYVPGKSGGMDDDVPAIIDGKEPARLSSGEFVFDAATVAALGDGNNAAGAKKLDGLRKAIRKKAYGHERQPPKNYSVGDLVRAYDRGR